MPPLADGSTDALRASLHDIRNLFGVVKSGTHLLEDSLPPEQRGRVIAAIGDAAMRGERVVARLLEAAPTIPLLESCEIQARLGGLEPMLTTLFAADQCLRIDPMPHPAAVPVSSEHLDRLILELVANARRALRESGQVTVRARHVDGRVWLTIADNGVGMSAEQVERALGLRAGILPGGRGNGLRQVRALVQGVGGGIRIRSRQGTGTVVSIILPLIEAGPPLPSGMGASPGRIAIAP